MEIIERNSDENISNNDINDNNANTKCCVTEDIIHDKITTVSLPIEAKYKNCVDFCKYLF